MPFTTDNLVVWLVLLSDASGTAWPYTAEAHPHATPLLVAAHVRTYHHALLARPYVDLATIRAARSTEAGT